MPTVVLAPALARWLSATPIMDAREQSVSVPAKTVREALAQVFAQFPTLRGYVVDERGGLRHHVVAYRNGSAVVDKVHLTEPLNPDDELYLFQALSGG